MNVRGCSTSENKRCEIGKMFSRRKIDVLALCETKMIGKGERQFGEVFGRVSGVERGRAREGVAMLLSKWMQDMVVEWKEVSARLLWVRVRLGRECWAFVSAYGPGCEKEEEEREDFWNDLTECVESLKRKNYVVVLGDLNARVGDEEVDGVVGKYGVAGRNWSGERLLEMCGEQELVIGNSWFKKKSVNKYTWMRVDGGRVVDRAMMDYVVIMRRLVGRLKDVHVRRGEGAGMSDHFLVEARIEVAKEWKNKRGGVKREVIKVEELNKVEREQDYSEKMRVEYELVREREVGGVEEEWKMFMDNILRSAREVCGMKRVGGYVRKGSEWWSEEVGTAVGEKRKAFEEWLQNKNDVTYERYKTKKLEVKRKVREAKRAADWRWGQKLGENYEQNKKMFWKEVKRVKRGESRREEAVKDENGQLLVEGGAVRRRWAEYFEGLLNVEDGREARIEAVGGVRMPVLGRENEREIERKEVLEAVNKTKSGKAPGLDGCAAELLKKGGDSVIDWLVRLLNVCFNVGRVPDGWCIACMVPLYKGKGDVHVCGNSRGISLLCVVGKVYGRIVINRVKGRTGGAIWEVQGGFMTGRGCVDQIFAVRQVCEKYLAKGKEVFFAFMDLEKAYDRVDRKAMWDILLLYGVGGKLLKAVQSFYVNSRACVRVGNEVSESFEVKVGLRQGCVMSPWLFNMYMDGVVREVNAKVMGRGAELIEEDGQRWELSQLLFADDTVLIADTEEKLCHLVLEFGRVCERRKLRVNVGKSKVMRCNRNGDGDRLFVSLNGEVLEEVDSFKYLGSVVEASGGVAADVRHRVNEGSKMLGAMKGVIKGRGVGMNVKKVLYEKIIVPTVLYGAETWGMRAAERQKLKVFEMRCLRSMAGVTRMDRIRNEEVRRRTGVRRELAVQGDMSVLRWFGHMERMEDERLTKRVMKSGVSGVQARGRPRFGWIDGVKRALNDRGLRMEEAKEIARDRNEWKYRVTQH